MKSQFGKGFGFAGGVSGSGGGQLTNPIVTTVPYLPGIPLSTNYPAGTHIETILDDLLAPYVKPAVSGLAIVLTPNDAFIEVGRVVPVVSASWAVTLDSEGHVPYNMVLTGDGFGMAVTGTSQAAVPASTTFLNAPGSKTWSLAAQDKNSVALTPSAYSRAWRFAYWLGATNAADPVGDVTATALAIALQQKQLLTSKAANFTCTADNDTAGNYTWIAYPASYGALTNIIQNGALPVLAAFTLIGTWNVTNAYGIVESYNFYKSNADKAFASGTTLAIS